MTNQLLPSLGSIRAAMSATNQRFVEQVVARRDYAALNDIYTATARILPPGAPMVEGRHAIRDFWTNMVQSANARSVTLESVDVLPAGEGVVEIGRALLTVEPPGQFAAQIEIKYVVYWRQEDSKWKWHVDIWNPNS